MRCPICDQEMERDVCEKPGLKIVRCSGCGFYGADLDEWKYPYCDKDYYSREVSVGEIDPGRSHVQHRVRGIRAFVSKGRAADLACGLGETAIALSQCGFETYGVEESTNAVEVLRETFPYVRWRCADVRQFLIEEQGFDLITLYHVLEHVPRPRELTPLLCRSLNEGGLLVIEVPDVSGGQARYLGWQWQHWIPHHVNYFSPRTLRMLFEPAGLQLLHIERKYHFLYPQGVWWKDTIHNGLARVGFNDIITTYWERR